MKDRKLSDAKRWIVKPETKKIEWCSSMGTTLSEMLECRTKSRLEHCQTDI